MLVFNRVILEYQMSIGIRGDNNPEYAKYLGYLSSKELYPDFDMVIFEEYLKKLIAGNATGVYAVRKKD